MKPISARKVSIPVPSVRCSAPGCGDKIKSCDPTAWMWEVTFDDGATQYIERGCEQWFYEGHPDYGQGWGVALHTLFMAGEKG